jgi:hypothetical protein
MPSQIFPNIVDLTEIKSAFLVVPNARLDDKLDVSAISKIDLAKRTYYNQKLEFPYFDKYILSYAYAYPKSGISCHWDSYEKALNDNICENNYKIEAPIKYTDATIKNILEVIQDGSSS